MSDRFAPASTGHGLDQLAVVCSRRKWLALGAFAMCAAASFTVALSLPPIYRSTATVIVEQSHAAGGTAELESRLQLISQEILSRSRLESLIQTHDLYPKLRHRASVEELVARARRDIRTESKLQPQPSGLGSTIALAISYRGSNPERVAQVANTLASSYRDEDRKLRERLTRGAVRVLKAQLDDVKKSLDEQERAVAQFQQRYPGGLPQQADVNMANLQRLHADLRTTTEERMRALDRRNELLREMDEPHAPAAAPSRGGAGPVAARLAAKRNELADLRQRYRDTYPDVIRLRDEVAALEQEVSSEPAAPDAPAVASGSSRSERLRGLLRELEGEIDARKADEARLRLEIGQQIQRLEGEPVRRRGYEEVARDRQATRDLYDAVRKRYEQALLDEGDPARPASSPFRILDPAIVPVDPVAPDRMILLVAALLGSLALGAAVAAVAETLDTSLHTADDVRAFTRVPIVTSIPVIVTAGALRARRRRAALIAACTVVALAAVVQGTHRFTRTKESVALMLSRP
jgi:polysaccharide chain length determinant protein (PEP-CTERM system associated)